MYKASGTITISPMWAVTQPCVIVRVDDAVVFAGALDTETTVDFAVHDEAAAAHTLSVEFNNKNYDGADALEMMITISKVTFQHFSDNFAHLSQYTPTYPELWVAEERQKGVVWPISFHSNTLGWNGIWQLEFETPIYQWLHQKLAYGWLLS